MKCPLPLVTLVTDSFPPDNLFRDCLEEECAWWDEEQKRCDPTGLAHWVRALIAQLWEIKEKMPHEEQFRR